MSTVADDRRLDMLTSVCARCGQRKTWRQFTITARFDDGSARRVDSYCKACRVDLTRDWETRNRPRRNRYRREWMRRQRAEVSAQKDPMLSAVPLRQFVQADGRDLWVIADLTGCSWDMISRLVKGRTRFVKLSNADRIVTRLDGRFDDLYPLADE